MSRHLHLALSFAAHQLHDLDLSSLGLEPKYAWASPEGCSSPEITENLQPAHEKLLDTNCLDKLTLLSKTLRNLDSIWLWKRFSSHLGREAQWMVSLVALNAGKAGHQGESDQFPREGSPPHPGPCGVPES